jgi:hypothetical protein
MKLTYEQRLQLVEWAAELLQLAEINARALKCDPPFEVDYLQLKHARKVADVHYRRDRAKADREVIARGIAQR